MGGAERAAAEVIGIDHIYIETFESSLYLGRQVMGALGFRKKRSEIAGEPHIHYYNRHFGFSLRPARAGRAAHDPYAPGLHHFCFRVEDERAVDAAAAALRRSGVDATEPARYPQYAPDYYATFFADPDGVRLEITNFRDERRRRMARWNGEEER